MKFSPLTEDKTEEITTELRVIVEVLDRKKIVEKGALLYLLNGLTNAKGYLDHLSRFFSKELEIHERSEG